MYDASQAAESALRLVSGAPEDTTQQGIERAMIFANVAIALALIDISKSIDFDGIADGVKQAAVELGGINITLSDR